MKRQLIAASAAMALLAGATAAHAGNPDYGVSTIVGIYGNYQLDNGRAYNPAYFYNVVGGQYPMNYPTGPYPAGDTGVYSHGGSSLSGLTSTGSTDTTGNLTSAYDGISGVDVSGGPASAYAGASLATGSLHATAAGTFDGVYEGEDYNSGAGAQADFYDTLTFNVAGANASTVTDITMAFDIDGSASSARDVVYGGQYMGLKYTLGLGGTDFTQDARWGPAVGGTGVSGPVPVYTDSISVNNGGGDLQLVGLDQIADSPDKTKLLVTYQLTGASVTAPIFDGLALSCGDGVSCNWLNTSSVSFKLPSGVTLSSASGAFLTAGVPEPGVWISMLLGLGLIGAGVRARRLQAARVA